LLRFFNHDYSPQHPAEQRRPACHPAVARSGGQAEKEISHSIIFKIVPDLSRVTALFSL